MCVLKDEELGGSCCITLEKCRMYYAVTCGVYGLMVHTAFFGQPEYEQKYAEMKRELASFVARMDSMTEDERSDFMDSFVISIEKSDVAGCRENIVSSHYAAARVSRQNSWLNRSACRLKEISLSV